MYKLLIGAASHSPAAVFVVHMGNTRNGGVFGRASVQFDEELFQGGCRADSKSSALAHYSPTASSRDFSELRSDLVLEDDAVFGVLTSVSSDSDDTSYGADTSDEFLSAVESARDLPTDESNPCGMKAAEAEWRTGVAVAMDAFRTCKGTDGEPIFITSKDSKKRSSETIALPPDQQIREIQNWRNYLRGDGDTSVSSEGGYVVDTSFQFP
ncbi:hypothetical protein M413DRAFT_379448 [Hebeloma cylindrosporum]|uniref:Uncharacterized protein n=1 Tax=Hebeloma cylindrosporum TaxID=76867 RepID=A0A0C2YTK1_HEBCY|nr:hypothetical protein M413DRAFT_379448 [Hebeloma cylindrosporum h7]